MSGDRRSLMEQWDKLERERVDAAFRMDMSRVAEIRALQIEIADKGAAILAAALPPSPAPMEGRKNEG